MASLVATTLATIFAQLEVSLLDLWKIEQIHSMPGRVDDPIRRLIKNNVEE